MAHGFFGLMKPYGGRRSSATATGMRQNQAGKDMCQMCRRINQRFLGKTLAIFAKECYNDF